MKTRTLLLVLLVGILRTATAQHVVVLNVNQPPEFGFSVSQTDTTILKGTSVVLGRDVVISGGSGDYKFLWKPAGSLDDPSKLNPLATPVDTTTYLLTVTDASGCSFTLSYTVNTRGPLVGIDAISGVSGLQAILFPNPNDGRFQVRLKGAPSEKIDVHVIDARGSIMTQQVIYNFAGEHTETLQLNLSSGFYTLRIHSGNELLSRQFVIQ